MIINTSLIASFEPCEDRFVNWINHYENFSGSFDDFIDLDLISYDDKIWVAKRVLNKNQLTHFGILCAESVLSIFEDKYTEDRRVRACLEHLMSYKDFSNLTEDEKEEILVYHRAAADVANAADATADAAAAAAVNAAIYAADAAVYASAVSAAVHAADATADAAVYAYAAIYAAVHAAPAAPAAYAAYDKSARKPQQELNLELLKIAASL